MVLVKARGRTIFLQDVPYCKLAAVSWTFLWGINYLLRGQTEVHRTKLAVANYIWLINRNYGLFLLFTIHFGLVKCSCWVLVENISTVKGFHLLYLWKTETKYCKEMPRTCNRRSDVDYFTTENKWCGLHATERPCWGYSKYYLLH